MSDSKPKICIIGAGPVGCTVSLFLSKHKITHVVVDKAKFPRDKVCGDGFTYEVVRALAEIDPLLAEEFQEADFVEPSGGFYVQNQKGNNALYPTDKFGPDFYPVYVAKRIDFDDWLFRKISSEYAEVREETSVEHINENGNGYSLSLKSPLKGDYEEYFDFLIGADGERSIVKKYLSSDGIKKKRDSYYGTLRTYYSGVKPISDKSPIEFHFLPNGMTGYLWIFRCTNDVYNVGIGIKSNEVSDQNINIRQVFNDYLEKTPHLKDRFKNAKPLDKLKGWGIPLNSNRFPLYGNGYVLIGDSAYMPEPHTGKGIGTAMFAAYLAIPTLLKAIENKDFSKPSLSGYQKAIEKAYYKEWDLQAKFEKWMYSSLGKQVLLKGKHFPFLAKPALKKIVTDMKRFSIPKGLKPE